MILASGARGPEFDSRIGPKNYFSTIYFFTFFSKFERSGRQIFPLKRLKPNPQPPSFFSVQKVSLINRYINTMHSKRIEPVSERYKYRIFESYSSSDLSSSSRRSVHNRQRGDKTILDSFTKLCVGEFQVPHRRPKRASKYVIYPIALYPSGQPRKTRKLQKKPIHRHLFRPILESEEWK